jgi:hypothetical protein
MRIGMIGASYTARSTAVADEECINWFAETVESQGSIVPTEGYGGKSAQGVRAYFGTPGLQSFCDLTPWGIPRASCLAGGRLFVVAGAQLVEIASDGTPTARGTLGTPATGNASIVSNGIQIFIVASGQAYCFTLASNALLNVTSMLAGTPIKGEYADTYFIVQIQGNKFQTSQLLDGTTWPGLQVNEVSVFPEDITSIICNHRELWVFGSAHAQPYQNTGSNEVYDVIPGTLIETGCAATFSPCRVDNSVFWINQDERGARSAWRSQGYTPARVSTHAVEVDLATYADISGLTSYAYQDEGHLFWVLYIPGSPWSWTYDVVEGLWAKRAFWLTSIAEYEAHHSWNHVYAFGRHLVGSWKDPFLYQMHMPIDNHNGSYSFVDDAGQPIRRLRRSPTVINEMEWIPFAKFAADFDTGLGPQPALQDGGGNDRAPQAMLRWSDNRGKTWSNEHIADCGKAGEYNMRVIWWRPGRSRYRVWELSVSDPIPWTLVDAYVEVAA